MTIESEVARDTYTGDGSTAVYEYSFRIFAPTDLRVLKISPTGAESLLTYPSGFAVAGVNDAEGGTITLPSVLPSGWRLVIYPELPLLQPADIRNQGRFAPELHEDQFDRQTRYAQQLQAKVGRSLVVSQADDEIGTLPGAATRAGKLLSFDEDGNPTVFNPTDLVTIAAYSDARVDSFTGDGTTTIFQLAADPVVRANALVSVGGSIQSRDGSAFTLNDPAEATPNIKFATAPADGLAIEVVYLRALDVGASSAATASYLPTSGVSARTVQDKLREGRSVKDFGVIGDGIVDDTVRLLLALEAVEDEGGGALFIPPDLDMAISQTLQIPSNVRLVGSGAGRVYQPTIAAASKLSWYGAASGVMVRFGDDAALRCGGGLSGIRLDGRSVAGRCLVIKNHQHGHMAGVVLANATQDALYWSNTAGLGDPTGFWLVDDLQIFLRGGATQSAAGITLDGKGAGVEGVTLCSMRNVRIEHANGAGVAINERGDAFLWDRLQTFRANSETGIGVWAYATTTGQVIGHHTFIKPVVSAGFRIDKAGQAVGWTIVGLDEADCNSSIVQSDVVYGEGCTDVTVLGSTHGHLYGPARTIGHRDTVRHDGMSFMRWDSGNNLLHTSGGVWKTGGDYTGANIQEAAQYGGAVEIATSSTSGEKIYILDRSAFTAGISTNYNPVMNFTWAPATGYTSNSVMRGGLFGDVGTTPTDGIYIEAAIGTSNFYRAVCRKGGAETAIVTSIGVANTKTQWRIEVDPAKARIFYRVDGNVAWALAGVFATAALPLTTTALAAGFYIRTGAAAQKSLHVYDFKLSHRSE